MPSLGRPHPEVIRNYNVRKVRFSATLGKEIDVQVALV